MKHQALLVAAAALWLAGCAGYNHTMFMTKSNAGLDVDMKPPTAEINIARKEAVIAPAFEKGQTPPVMASFKPSTGFGGTLKNYFVGVNQTFAGGDAAKTMAVLYDSPTFRAGDDSVFDSTLNLEKPLNGNNFFLDPAPPGKVRPFIFATDTSLGLKVAWSGAGGQFPDTVKAGFNRKEFAWAPIVKSKDGKQVKMPSFLASIESNIGGQTDIDATQGATYSGGISAIQYFATGEAASRLARQKDVREAMLKRLDPEFATKSQFGQGIIARQMLTAMETTLNQVSPTDPVAQAFYGKLQDLKGVHVPASFAGATPPMFFYARVNGATNVFDKITNKTVLGAGSKVSLDDATSYLFTLESSMSILNSIRAQLTHTNQVFLVANGSSNPQPVQQIHVYEMSDQMRIQAAEHDRVEAELAADPDVSAAFGYFTSLFKR